MSDASMPNQASEPNQEVGASQQAQVFAPPNPGGSAVLDANNAAGVSTNPEGKAIASLVDKISQPLSVPSNLAYSPLIIS